MKRINPGNLVATGALTLGKLNFMEAQNQSCPMTHIWQLLPEEMESFGPEILTIGCSGAGRDWSLCKAHRNGSGFLSTLLGTRQNTRLFEVGPSRWKPQCCMHLGGYAPGWLSCLWGPQLSSLLRLVLVASL